MPQPEYVSRADVVAALVSKQLQIRAEWVQREFSPYIEVHKSSAILSMLGIDLDSIPRVEITPLDEVSLDMVPESTDQQPSYPMNISHGF
jgi:hypothetical protein